MISFRLTSHLIRNCTHSTGLYIWPEPVKPEAEIYVYAFSEISKLWEWNYLTLLIDCIELISTWIYILPSYDQSGQLLIARATEGHIFILDARPSKLFQVLGYIGNTCNNINYIFFSLFSAFKVYLSVRPGHSPSFYLFSWRTKHILPTYFLRARVLFGVVCFGGFGWLVGFTFCFCFPLRNFS